MSVNYSTKFQAEQKKETRNKILDSAYYLFCEKDYFKTNTKKNAKYADVAVGNFYFYY